MSRRSKSTREGSTVDKEVANLFRMGDRVDQAALLRLRNKYGDNELVSRIQDVFVHQHSAVVKHAKKFAQAVRNRYASTNVPYHMLLQKARLHARKYKLSEAAFAEFVRIYEQELAGTSRRNEVVVPLTNMMKVLGNLADTESSGFDTTQGDYRNLQEILKLNAASKPLHAQVLLQSMTYQPKTRANRPGPLSPAALAGVYDRTHHVGASHVHPVLVALFLNKIRELDTHFLQSNISNIVATRYNKQALNTRPDYELFYDMVTDPNDIICDNSSPLADLLHRANLQNQLWNNVLHLRNGQFYNASFGEFMAAVDVCRLNKYDNPDLVYGRHDGTVVKRLLSAFSYRPTVVATYPTSLVPNMGIGHNPYAQSINPTVTRVPMVTIRLVNNVYQANPALAPTQPLTSVARHVEQAMPMQFIEGNAIVSRASKVLYSRGVLIVYIDRRSTHISLDFFKPMTMKNFPVGVSGFSRINNDPMDIDDVLTIQGSQFSLRSVVVADTKSVALTQGAPTTPLVIGSKTIIYNNDGQRTALNYDPLLPVQDTTVNTPILAPNQGGYVLPNKNTHGLIAVYTAASDTATDVAIQAPRPAGQVGQVGQVAHLMD